MRACVCVCVCVCLFVCLSVFVCVYYPPQGQPHAAFGGCKSVSGGMMLLCWELITAEDSPHT